MTILIGFCQLTPIAAQDPFHITYTVDDGLPSNELYDLHVTKKNLIWVTSDRGVSTFDGYDFKTYSKRDGLAYLTNFKIIPDQFDRLWFNGFDGSISRFEHDSFTTVKFDRVYADDDDGTTLDRGSSYFNGVGLDSLGYIFLHEFRIANNKDDKIFVVDQNNRIEKKHVRFDTLAQSSAHDLTLERLRFSNADFYRVIERISFLDAVAEIGDDKILFAIRKSANRNNRPRKRYAELFLYEKGEIRKLFNSETDITAIYVDRDANILVGTYDGILIYRHGDLSKEPTTIFKSRIFTSIDQDLEGNYWATTKSGLLFFPTIDLIPINIGNNTIIKLSPLHDHLVMNSIPSATFYKNKESEAVFKLDATAFNNLQHFNVGREIIKYDGTYILSEKFGDIKLIDLEEQSKVRSPLVSGITKKITETLFKAEDVYRKNFRKKKITRRRAFVVDRNFDVWIGTLNGLYYVDADLPELLIKFSDGENKLNVRVSDIKIDEHKNIWVSTIGDGVILIRDKQIVNHITMKEGLSSDVVNGIHLEADSVLWVCTNQGLNRIDFNKKTDAKELKITKLYNIDGLPSSYIYDFTEWNGNYWLATSSGLVKFDKSHEFKVKKRPSLTLNSVMINDSRMSSDSVELLRHDENNLTFSFTGISYQKPQDDFYRYSLTKSDEPLIWEYTNYRSVDFSNLSSGDYNFKVQARNKDGLWSEAKYFRFTIKPHFTKTWWFLALCLIATIIFVYLIFRARIAREKRIMEVKRVLGEAELKTEIAALTTFRNQFNPHFIFNSLNSIQNYIMENNTLPALNFLSSFSKLIRQSLNLSTQEYVTIARELEFLESYLNLELERFPNKFDFDFVTQEDLILEEYLMPSLLLQPTIENVLKHAFENIHGGMLSIYISSESDSIHIKVIDNGKGINQSKMNNESIQRKSFGLKITKDRISLLKLRFPEVESKFTISERVNTKGTIVEFIIPKIQSNEYN